MPAALHPAKLTIPERRRPTRFPIRGLEGTLTALTLFINSAGQVTPTSTTIDHLWWLNP